MIKKGRKFTLAVISIRSINETQLIYYQKVEFGDEYKTKISRDDVCLKQGKRNGQ